MARQENVNQPDDDIDGVDFKTLVVISIYLPYSGNEYKYNAGYKGMITFKGIHRYTLQRTYRIAGDDIVLDYNGKDHFKAWVPKRKPEQKTGYSSFILSLLTGTPHFDLIARMPHLSRRMRKY
jgi:hypothetical protein